MRSITGSMYMCDSQSSARTAQEFAYANRNKKDATETRKAPYWSIASTSGKLVTQLSKMRA